MPPSSLLQIGLGILLGGLAALLAYRARSLSRSGAAVAALEGAIIFGLGGLEWAVLLLAFFLSSSVLSRTFGRRKSALAEKFSKGSRRDAGQVLANGGAAAAFALLGFGVRIAGGGAAPDWAWLAFAGSLAAVNADTWATELGVLSRETPRLITSGARVERGTSGGVTLAGTLAALGGAAFIALPAILLRPPAGGATAAAFALLAAGGLAGSLLDSLLGATLQAIYTCPACQKETERHPLHTCGSATAHTRGWAWLNNDWVNAACALTGALAALGLWLAL